MDARELAQSLMAQQLHNVSLGDLIAGRANLLATQQVAWAKQSILESPREIAWARCKTLSQNALKKQNAQPIP
jgi:hypothetical protein